VDRTISRLTSLLLERTVSARVDVIIEATEIQSTQGEVMKHRGLSIVLSITAAAGLSSCKSLYYSTLETFGTEKRDILVDRIEDARDGQTETKEEFQSALEKFKTVANVEGGDLESKYDELNAAYESSAAQAQDIRERIESVEEVAADLFEEWSGEIDQIGNAEMRANSKQMMSDTKGRYERLIGLMKQAEQKMEPVLGAFKDQVLMLKHNLNAKAIASLQGNLEKIETDVQALLRDMEKSIQEANTFMATMENPS
jgi:hypothetical protein